jgi:hypothetical protein
MESGWIVTGLVGGGLALAMFADVMPHCGGPTVVIRNPGEDCGHHGARWRGDCRAPAACWMLDKGGARCSIACEKNDDCAALGPGFTCSAQGTPYSEQSESGKRSLCRNASMP